MSTNQKHLLISFCVAVVIIVLTACGSSTSHCYLCEGIPHDEPCVVNLATGDIVVLSVGGYGHAALSITGGISVTGENGELCSAIIPSASEEMNPRFFCDDCLPILEATPNTGYVLADLSDLSNIKLYSIKDTTIRNYNISVSKSETAYEIQMVKG